SQRVMQHPVAMTNTSADTTRDNSMMVATNSQRVMQHPVAMTNTSADTTRDNSMMVATDSQRVMQHPVAMTNTSADTTRDNSMMVATNSQRVMQHPVAMTNASSVVAEVPKIPVNQKDLYQVAYEMLRNGHHIRAIAAFKSLLIEFPDGEYADNSQYWLGEAYIVNDDREAAKVAFTKVVTHYGKSPKAPDALLKLGYMELEQNNIAKAKDYLTQVAFSHPGTTASYLATKKLRLIATE
ncbi:MAG: tol-pal system protein YbgF, partial [Methylococcales symbiont of Iophon sp. n. MRB-2018]